MNKTDKVTEEYLENNTNIIRSLYDTLRVVDPEKKQVLIYNKGTFIEKRISCFNEVNRNSPCENCISMRAINSKSTFMKIECIDEKVYMISAVPVEMKDITIVVELIKDVTDSLFYGSSIYGGSCKVNNILKDMKKIATRDNLTGTYNRRFIDEKLPVDMNNCRNKNEHISIIMVDIDYFKNINDTFGHTTGDFVLKEFTKFLKRCIRNKKDWIARYGGEEFLICIPGANEKVVMKIAERMLEYIRNNSVYYKEKEIKITASFGICTIFNENISIEEFINCADKNLYIAKNSGRDRVIF